MSRPRPRHRRGSPAPPPSYAPIPVGRSQATKLQRTLRPTLIMPLGRTYAQLPGLPPLPGQVAFVGDPLLHDTAPNPPSPVAPDDGNNLELYLPPHDSPYPGSHGQKKIRQWARWQDEVIPQLVEPFMRLLAQSQSLSQVDTPSFTACTCRSSKMRKVNLTILSFAHLQPATLNLCTCLPPLAQQLVAQGLFPCAPVIPSLAIDLRVLDFASRLFLYLPPNNTAWCNAIEDFLDSLGFKLTTENSLRRRFENSLRWFMTLKHTVADRVSEHIASTRPTVTGWIDGALSPSTSTLSPPSAPSPPSDIPSPSVLSTSCPPSGHESSHELPSTIRRDCLIAHMQAPATTSLSSQNSNLFSNALSSSSQTDPTPVVYPHDDQPPSVIRPTPVQAQQSPGLPQQQPPISLASGKAASQKRKQPDTPESPVSDCPTAESFPEPQDRNRPSDYLCGRCLLCFGGEFPPQALTGPNAIVCLDACFTQKRNKGKRDPERVHPDSVFIPEKDIIKMQHIVDAVRPSKEAPKKTKKKKDSPPEEQDGYEGTLKVPASVLNGCEASFTAADEQREKASTQFFDDTALMALLCRHDRVLWVANMRSAGERQYYALVLIETLFQHLPRNFLIGLLYDIGCQLHRSCIKWGFLERYLNRLSFGISVFHAFGHQWPCQIIYHPRKCEGFGLSDGEGCERFWHSISKLIPVLRVSGYHQRLYTLDTQIHHLDVNSLQRLGQWLLRRFQHCRNKHRVALEALEKSGHSEEFLRAQWKAQVDAQTKPLSRRSKNQGKLAVEEVIRLRKAYDVMKSKVHELEQHLTSSTPDPYLYAISLVEMQDARESLVRLEGQLLSKQRKLGVKENEELTRLVNNPYVGLRMNALALKSRLRDRLRSRKFELDPIERMVRKPANARKLHSHTESSVQRRDPSIKQVARAYNALCDQMQKLIEAKKAPAGSVSPSKVPMEGLFSLDVDNDIWQDLGLTDDGSEMIPLWLSDDDVRSGIKALLERDRCVEEESRLQHERRAMQIWFGEEWNVLSHALMSADGDEGIRYQIKLRKDKLCSIYAVWTRSVRQVPAGDLPLPPWGPSSDDLLAAQQALTTPSFGRKVHTEDDPLEDDNTDTSTEGEDSDDELNEMVTAFDMVSMAYGSIDDEDEFHTFP